MLSLIMSIQFFKCHQNKRLSCDFNNGCTMECFFLFFCQEDCFQSSVVYTHSAIVYFLFNLSFSSWTDRWLFVPSLCSCSVATRKHWLGEGRVPIFSMMFGLKTWQSSSETNIQNIKHNQRYAHMKQGCHPKKIVSISETIRLVLCIICCEYNFLQEYVPQCW